MDTDNSYSDTSEYYSNQCEKLHTSSLLKCAKNQYKLKKYFQKIFEKSVDKIYLV